TTGVGRPMEYDKLLPYEYGFGVAADNPLAIDLAEPLELMRMLIARGVPRSTFRAAVRTTIPTCSGRPSSRRSMDISRPSIRSAGARLPRIAGGHTGGPPTRAQASLPHIQRLHDGAPKRISLRLLSARFLLQVAAGARATFGDQAKLAKLSYQDKRCRKWRRI